MSIPKWRRYLRFYRPDPIADLDDELRDHLDSATEALVATGMTATAARDEAHRRYGNVAGNRREVARMDMGELRRSQFAAAIETLVQDVRFAMRSFARSPGFVAVAALSIAVAVAANSVAFSVVNAVLMRPVPGVNADGLVRVYVNHHSPFSWQNLSWFRDRSTSFAGIVGERYGAMSFRAGAQDQTERVRTSLVTRGYFTTLGVRTALGGPFDGDERTADGARPVAVLSHDFWKRRFGGDSSVIGRTVTVSEHPVVIVGVGAPEFRSAFLGRAPDLFLPFAAAPALMGIPLEDFGGSLYTTARLKPGVSQSSAEAELQVLMSQLARTDSARYERMSVRLSGTRGVEAEGETAATAGAAFLMFMVGIVLLIACANVANLLLGRATARQSEIGVRLALGASRGRIIRQLLTECLLIALVGTAVGLAITVAVMQALVAAMPAEAGISTALFAPDARMVAFTLGMCILTTLLFGLVPALRATNANVVPMIKADVQRGGRPARRGALLAAQSALCVLMLAVASLFWRSLVSMRGLDTGFSATGVVNVPVDLALVSNDPDAQRAHFERIQLAASALAGVQAATLAGITPLTGSSMETRVAPEGMAANSRFDLPMVHFNVVTPGYFETLTMPLQQGRGFLPSDVATSTRVAVINQTAAERWWPGQNAIGRRFKWGGLQGPDVQVVGIARNADYNMPGEDRKVFVYLPLSQESRSDMVLHLRTRATVAETRDAIWSVLRAETPTLPPPPVSRMTDDMAITLLPVRIGATLLSTLGLIALLLSATGIYGVTAYAVARRTREIGIRSALGAGRARVVRMVVSESLKPVSRGLAIGLALALLAAFGIGRVLYGVRALDPVVMPGVIATLLLVATAASLVPAWRAARVNPTIAMRTE